MSGWFYHPWPADEAAAPSGPVGAIKGRLFPLIDSQRRRTTTVLSPPAVVGGGVAFNGPGVLLADTRQHQLRRRTQWFRRPPVVVAPQRHARPIAATLAPSSRGVASSFLRPPAPAAAASLTEPTRGYLFPLGSDRRRLPLSILRPPEVVAEPEREPVSYGPGVRYVRSHTLSRRTTSALAPPIVGEVVFVAPPVKVALARIRPPRTLWRLRPPVVIDLTPQTKYVAVTLTYSLRGKPISQLSPPTVVDLRPQVYTVFAWLAYSRRGRPTSFLRRPADTVGLEDQGRVRITLARVRPAPTAVALRPPTVIDLTPQTRYVTVSLAYSRRGAPHSFLRPPSDVADIGDQGRVVVHLARIRPQPTVTRLGSPTVVTILLSEPTRGYLFPLGSDRRRPVRHVLASPAVVAQPFSGHPVSVTLARIRPVSVASRLFPPSVVGGGVSFDGPGVLLAPSSRGKPKSFLRPPPLARVEDVAARVRVTLARIRPRRTSYDLGGPVVVFAGALGGTAVSLAYQSRGRPISLLSPPQVVSAFAARPVLVSLAPSSRGTAKPFLLPATVVAPVLARAVATSLAPQRRGEPTSFLNPPTVVQFFSAAPTRVTLAAHRRGEPLSRLRPPAVVAPVLARAVSTSLAPQRRGEPFSRLRPPAVVAPVLARAAIVSLAPQRRGRATSFLTPLALARAFVAEPTRVTFAPQRRGEPLSRLRPPAVVAPVLARAVAVTLAASRRGEPFSRLRADVFAAEVFAAEPVRVSLTQPPRRRAVSTLRPPAVVGEPDRFFGPQTTLTRIRPVPTRWLLRPAQVVAEQCFGTVTGFDFAPDVCGSDDAADVTGTDAGASVSGADSGATVGGMTAGSGTVGGGDEQREGC